MSKLTGTHSSTFFRLTALSVALSALSLTACGGGGGGTVDSVAPQPDTGIVVDKGNGGNGKGIVNPDVAQLKVSNLILRDAITGDITNSVTSDGAEATVTVTNAKGEAIENAMVTFEAGGVNFKTSSNATVLTDSKGIASISLAPADSNDTGAYSIVATAKYNGLSASSNSVNYSLQALNLKLDNLVIGETDLESGASTLVSLVTKNADTDRYQNNVNVSFNTTCGTFKVDSVVSSSQGNVENTYSTVDENGELCEGEQTITVTSSNGLKETAKVNIREIKASSIVYTDREVYLGTKNSGSAGTKQIEFTVYANGKEASNQEVKLELVKAPNDFSFISLNNRDEKVLKSDSSGRVSVDLYPGNIPGPVEVKASLVSDEKVFAVSKKVSVATGRPVQYGLTLAPKKSVSLASKVSDIEMVAFATDRQGNGVPKGTVINFVSEGGAITPRCYTNEQGRCPITYTTQRPHPADGRVTILAYTEGEKAYTDADGDNIFTKGKDTFKNNIGDFFRDDNESLIYESGNNEFLYHRPILANNNKAPCGKSSLDEPNIPDTCDDSLDTVVRTQILMGLASNNANLTDVSFAGNFLEFKLYGNKMMPSGKGSVTLPSGTTVKVTASDKTKDNKLSCKAEMVGGYGELPATINLASLEAYTGYSVILEECAGGDMVKVEVSIPEIPKQIIPIFIP